MDAGVLGLSLGILEVCCSLNPVDVIDMCHDCACSKAGSDVSRTALAPDV